MSTEKVVMPKDDYSSACDTIRGKTDTTELIKSNELASKIEAVYQKGYEQGKSEGDGNISDMYNESTQITFQNNPTVEHIELDMRTKTSMAGFAWNCQNLKTVKLENTNKVTDWIYAFRGCPNLESIEGLNFSGASNINTLAFVEIPKVSNFKVVPETIKASINIQAGALTHESKQSVVDGLAYVSTAKTLTIHGELTDEQKATINEKGWTLAQ